VSIQTSKSVIDLCFFLAVSDLDMLVALTRIYGVYPALLIP
jgi:hypothetical protein